MIMFLELTDSASDEKILINVNEIEAVCQGIDVEYTTLCFASSNSLRVKETYEEIYGRIAALIDRERTKNV